MSRGFQAVSVRREGKVYETRFTEAQGILGTEGLVGIAAIPAAATAGTNNGVLQFMNSQFRPLFSLNARELISLYWKGARVIDSGEQKTDRTASRVRNSPYVTEINPTVTCIATSRTAVVLVLEMRTTRIMRRSDGQHRCSSQAMRPSTGHRVRGNRVGGPRSELHESATARISPAMSCPGSSRRPRRQSCPRTPDRDDQ